LDFFLLAAVLLADLFATFFGLIETSSY